MTQGMPPRSPWVSVFATLAVACSAPNPAFVAPARDAAVAPATSQEDARTDGGGADRSAADVGAEAAAAEAQADGPMAEVSAAPPDVAADLAADLASDVAPNMAPDTARDGTADGVADLAPEGASAAARRIAVSDDGATKQYGGSGGSATARSETCGADQVLIGYLGNTDSTHGKPVVSGLQARCGSLKVTGGPPYVITVEPTRSLQPVGGSTADPFTALCPASQVLVAFFGRAGVALDQVGFRCAPLTVTDDATMTVVVGAPTSFGPWPVTDGGNAFAEGCKAGAAATGHSVIAGTSIDALALQCGKLSLVP